MIFLSMLLCFKSIACLTFASQLIEKTLDNDSRFYLFNFKFVNNSDKKIKILSVENSCSCIVADLNKKIYSPMETGVIEGRFMWSGDGYYERKITVNTDDNEHPRIDLFLKLKVVSPIKITKQLVYWLKNDKVIPKNVVLTISNPSWKMESVLCDNAKFAVKTTSRGNKHNIAITPLNTKTVLRDIVKIVLKNDNGQSKTLAVHALIK